jgi:hypothetical protein
MGGLKRNKSAKGNVALHSMSSKTRGRSRSTDTLTHEQPAKIFCDPEDTLNTRMESTSYSDDPVAPQGSNRKFTRQPRTLLTSPVIIISFQ